MTNIEHSGIKGQKHGIRRFQYEDGSLTPEGRLRYGVGEARKAGSTKKTTPKSNPKQTIHNGKEAKKALDERQKAEAAKKAEEERKKGKDAAINSGKASEVAKYRDLMTTQELKNAINRIDTEQNLDRLLAAEAERTRGKTFIEKFKDTGAKISTIVSTVRDVTDKVSGAMDSINNVQNKLANKDKEAEEAATKAKEEQRKKEVQKAVRTGDANAISAVLSKMTDAELESAVKRLSNIDTIDKRKK